MCVGEGCVARAFKHRFELELKAIRNTVAVLLLVPCF